MSKLSRALGFCGLMCCLPCRPALAVTLHDIVELTRAGLDDEVIVALLEVDRTIFGLDAAKIIELRQAGVTERVLVAMLRNGRTGGSDVAVQPASAAPLQEQAPQVVVIGHQEAPAPGPSPYFVPYPVYVRVPGYRRAHVLPPPDRTEPHRTGTGPQPGSVTSTAEGFGRFMNISPFPPR